MYYKNRTSEKKLSAVIMTDFLLYFQPFCVELLSTILCAQYNTEAWYKRITIYKTFDVHFTKTPKWNTLIDAQNFNQKHLMNQYIEPDFHLC